MAGETSAKELHDKLYGLITQLSQSIGAGTSARGVDGVAAASVTMLSKMISKYEMTKVRSPYVGLPDSASVHISE